MYSLANRDTGKLIQYEMHSNEGKDFCGAYTYELSEYGDRDWMVESLDTVLRVLYGPETPWYNSDMDCPVVCDYIKQNYHEVVKVTITVEPIEATPDFIVIDEEFIRLDDYKDSSIYHGKSWKFSSLATKSA